MPVVQPSFQIKKDHPCLAGHFPGNPIVPGVVILDEVASIILQQNSRFKIAGFSSVKFLQPLLAEQQVFVQVKENSVTSTGYSKVKFFVYNNDTLMAQGEIKLKEQAGTE